MHYILFIIGIIIVLFSIFIIYRRGEEEKRIYIEVKSLHEEIIDYVNVMEDIIKDLEILIDNSLNKIEIINEKDEYKQEDAKTYEPIFLYEEEDKPNSLDEEVVKLVKHGYSNKEIARKLKKGRREIDIILKMYKNKNNN